MKKDESSIKMLIISLINIFIKQNALALISKIKFEHKLEEYFNNSYMNELDSIDLNLFYIEFAIYLLAFNNSKLNNYVCFLNENLHYSNELTFADGIYVLGFNGLF